MFEDLSAIFSAETHIVLTLAFFTAIIVIYSIFVFYFYRFLARKNIIELNLNQYNQYSNQVLIKIFAGILYVLEYIVLLPILTFFWFAILATLILVLAKDLSVDTILLMTSALVASIRVTSYVNEDLAKDLAKMLPFTLLAISITTAGFFNITDLLSRINEIPGLISSNIPYYLLFIVAIELIMRITDFIQSVVIDSKASEES
jgi:hypothetical protein